MIRKILSASGIAMLCTFASFFYSCDKSSLAPDENREEKEDVVDYGKSKFEDMVVMLGEIDNKYFFEAIGERLEADMLAYVPEEDALVFVEMDDFSENKDILKCALEDGKAIAFIKPDIDLINGWLDEIDFPVRFYDAQDCWIAALFAPGSIYTLHQPVTVEVDGTSDSYPHTDEEINTGSDFTDIDKENVEEEPDQDEQIKCFLEPFVLWVNDALDLDENETKAETDRQPVFEPIRLSKTMTFKANAKVWQVSPSSDSDYLSGEGSMTYSYEITPLYAFEGQGESSGDYYSVTASYSIMNNSMFHDTDRIGSHGAFKTYAKGFYLHDFKVSTELDGPGAPDIVYTASGFPIPESTQSVVKYNKSSGWNIGGGISGRYGQKGWRDVWNVRPSFSWGYSESKTTQMDIPDISIGNVSVNARPAWNITCNNLPHKDSDGSHDISDGCPEAAKSGFNLRANWIWYYPKSKDWDTKSLGNIKTKFTAVYDAIATDSGVRYTRTLAESDNLVKVNGENTEELPAPGRIPFGTVQIKNTFSDGSKVTNIVISDVSGNVIESPTTTLAANDFKNFNLAVGEYKISLYAGIKKSTSKQYNYVTVGGGNIFKMSKMYNQNEMIKLAADYDFE